MLVFPGYINDVQVLPTEVCTSQTSSCRRCSQSSVKVTKIFGHLKYIAMTKIKKDILILNTLRKSPCMIHWN